MDPRRLSRGDPVPATLAELAAAASMDPRRLSRGDLGRKSTLGGAPGLQWIRGVSAAVTAIGSVSLGANHCFNGSAASQPR